MHCHRGYFFVEDWRLIYIVTTKAYMYHRFFVEKYIVLLRVFSSLGTLSGVNPRDDRAHPDKLPTIPNQANLINIWLRTTYSVHLSPFPAPNESIFLTLEENPFSPKNIYRPSKWLPSEHSDLLLLPFFPQSSDHEVFTCPWSDPNSCIRRLD